MNSQLFLDMLFTLLSKKTVTSKYLAQKFEVSQRTVFRYIEILSVSGVPIWITRGKMGGIFVPDTYKLPSGFLNKEELEGAVSAINSINSQLKNPILQRAALKLSSQLKNSDGNRYTSGSIIFDCGNWGNPDAFKDRLSVIENALNKNMVADIEYHDRGGEITRRKIEPHLLVFKQNIWYAYAFCRLRKDFRFFKISRIRHVFVTEEKFIKKDLSNYELPFNNWYNSGKLVEVEVEIDKAILSDAEEWLGIENITIKNGQFYALVKLPDEEGLILKILSFGKGIKILSPEFLKIRLKNYIKNLSEIY